MARTDIARMLTGVGGPAPVQAMPGTAGFAGQFGAQTTAGMGQAIGALTRGGAPSYEETVVQTMIELSSPTTADGQPKPINQQITDLTKVVRVHQAQGNSAAAGQAAAKIKQLKEEALKEKQAKDLALKVNPINSALAEQIVNQVPGSMAAGLEALQPKGERVNIVRGSDRQVIGTAIQKPDGSLVNQDGRPITLPAGVGVSKTIPGKGLSLAPDPSAEVLAKSLERNLTQQGKMFETVDAKMPQARQKIETAQRIYASLEKVAPSGNVAERIVNLAENVQSAFSVLGVETPKSVQKAISEGTDLKQIGFKAMEPLIEAQGRGFTDKDREHAKKVLPGLSQSWQYNEMIADLNTLDAYITQDQMLFANKRRKLSEVTDQAGETLWTSYLNDLSMSKTEVVNEGTESAYTRLVPIKTNEDLSQYWVKARPKGFKVKSGSKVVEMSFKDIRETAASKGIELSPREFLADLSRQGLLIDGVYE